MTTIVLDASVIVKWIFADRPEGTHSLQALHILRLIQESRVSVLQPPHWLAETAAVVTRLDPDRAHEAISLLHALEFPVVLSIETYHKACDLSASFKQHVFDTLYHAVALTEEHVTLITADDQYYRKAHKAGRIVRLRDFNLATT